MANYHIWANIKKSTANKADNEQHAINFPEGTDGYWSKANYSMDTVMSQ